MDSPIIFTICAFLMLMVFISWGGYRIFYKPGKFLKQLGRPVITSDARAAVMVVKAPGVAPLQSTTASAAHARLAGRRTANRLMNRSLGPEKQIFIILIPRTS